MDEPGRKLKVFVCGDVLGRFNSLFNRINSVQGKMGKFDLLFCVGDFFGSDMTQWLPYKNGEKEVPLTTYVLGCNKDEDAQHFMDEEGGELCDNVTYLGKHGLFTSTSGLTVGYLSGRDGDKKSDFSHFSEADIRDFKTKMTARPNFKGIDIFLTSVWPEGVSLYGTELKRQPKDASALVAQLALALKPRYHFSALEGISYERNPYRNHKLLSGHTTHVSRFVALAQVGNTEKLKYLYAFNIAPMKHMETEELQKQPVDTTECPYALVQDSHSDQQETGARNAFFYGESPAPGSKRHGKPGAGEPGSKKRAEAPKPQGPCWFCLGSPEVEKHLVVSVGTSVYLALAKGGLNQHHVLILPIGHFQSQVTCADDVIEEITKYKAALKKFFKAQDKAVVFFERNFKSSHTQIQTIAFPKSKADMCLKVFMDKAQQLGIDLVEIPERSELKEITSPGKTYFHAELPTGERLYCKIQKNFPIQFGREVLADKALLNRPESVDWRNCVSTKEEEIKIAKDFQKAFKSYDFNAL